MQVLTWFVSWCSLPQRNSVHIHPPPSWRRPESLRTRLRTVVSYPERREDPDFGYEYACGTERRESGECRSGEDVEGAEG